MILIITGPPAAGKTTIGNMLSAMVPNCALIDADALRAMVRDPHIPPWQGGAGNQQLLLGVKNACTLAREFHAQHLNVIILDVLTNESREIYANTLSDLDLNFVLLMPSLETCLKRNKLRGQLLQDQEVELLYNWQENLKGIEHVLDNSTIPAKPVAQILSRDFF